MTTTSSYTLKFSDPNNSDVIVVEGTKISTGKNNYDTSLDLIGPGYPNFGQATAQNFLKLLENFASPTPPVNPVKGQLWYDTSEPGRFVLRVNNGTLSTNRWPSVSGTYQQPNDPAIEYPQSIREGDIWVDTSASQLKIRYSSRWLVVGPNFSAGEEQTGQEAKFIEDVSGTPYPVIFNWVNGKVVEIISYFEFTPRTVIEGFSTILPGSNLTSRIPVKYNGLADRASSLELSPGLTIRASEVLKNRATSQVHTGTFTVESNTGLIVRHSNAIESLKLSTTSVNGVTKAFIDFSNLQTNSSFKIGIKENSYILMNSNGNIGVNTATSLATLHVNGTGRFNGSLAVGAGLTVSGNASFSGNVQSAGMTVNGVMTVTNAINLSIPNADGAIIGVETDETYDIGTDTKKFRKIYAKEVGVEGVTRFLGTLEGQATSLATQKKFSISGQVSASSINFDGTDDVNLSASLRRSAITAQTAITEPSPTHMLLVADSAVPTQDLRQISRANFLKDVLPFLVPTGMIMPFAGPGPVSGFLKCDGSSYSTIGEYKPLFDVIGTTYGGVAGNFNVPDLTTQMYSNSTDSSPTPIAINYYIKT